MRTIVHLSDLHFGKTDPRITDKLLAACIRERPNVVIISGDLTQRAQVSEFKEARTFLETLKRERIAVFVIPGNHDIRPHYQLIARVLTPYDRYREFISSDTEPRYLDDELAIAGIDTVRRGKIVNGAISRAQIRRVEGWFRTLDTKLMRIVVTHHPVDLPAVSRFRQPLVSRAKRAVYGLEKSRIDLYLAGHYHRASVITTAERYRRLATPAIAVQAGTVSLRERGEAQSYNTIFLDGPEIRVETHYLPHLDAEFEVRERRRFMRIENVWGEVHEGTPIAFAH